MSFTCIACRVAFQTADQQRAHYRTDFHRYNLKRKVAELPPVSAETFQQKVLSQRGNASEENSKPFCEVCKKRFSSENVYADHLKSKKHKETESRLAKKAQDKQTVDKAEKMAVEEEVDDDEEVIEGDENEALEITQCLFCEHESKDVEENVKHMARSHSFFIPEVEFLAGLKGLIGYLGAKVGMGHVCVWCNRPFSCVEAVRHHMVDKGHTFMLYNDTCRGEYADFYDFRSSYPDYDPQAPRKKDSVQDEEQDSEDEVEGPSLVSEDGLGELVLPSGARAGHRSLWRYYRQSLPPERQAVQRSRLSRVIAQYQSIGWSGSVALQRVAKEKQRMERAAYTRHESHHHERLGVKANKLQTYYRRRDFVW